METEEKFVKKFKANKDFKAVCNDKSICLIKNETYDKVDLFWKSTLESEKIIERSK